ncbi:MAG: substrate-binding domain-containing protein [Akkermansiaceae bacterium]|nr:substrate-binding domain-containing protein [Akkermansiaceae bacterium]
MESINVLSAAEQVAEHLRLAILRGELGGTMPGAHPLAAELGVNHKTVKAALKELEREGLLVPQGAGLGRKIVPPEEHAPPALRVAVLFYEKGDELHDLYTRFQNKLKAAGHTVVHAPKNQTDLGGNLQRLAHMIEGTGADAWVVISGSGEVLQYFEQRQIPVFALYGWASGLRIAGIAANNVPAIAAAMRRLIALGHRRIVMLESRATLSNPGPDCAAFLDELAAHGIEAGNYNMPGWEGGYDGFYRCLESLFARTPPTAMFLFSTAEYFATTQFLVHRGLRVPQDVSLICCDVAPYFKRYQPTISHVRWSAQLMVNRIARWATNISHGKEDTRQTKIAAEFVEGETVGPAPKRR